MRNNEAKWVESRKRWQINIQSDGQRRTFTSSVPGTKGKIQTEQKADAWLTSNTVTENMKLKKLSELFLDEVLSTTSQSNYIKHEQMIRLWLFPRLGKKRQ